MHKSERNIIQVNSLEKPLSRDYKNKRQSITQDFLFATRTQEFCEIVVGTQKLFVFPTQAMARHLQKKLPSGVNKDK